MRITNIKNLISIIESVYFYSKTEQPNKIAIDTRCNNGCQYLSIPLPIRCALCLSSLCAIHSVAVCVCRLFILTVFALARIIFCTCRPRRQQSRQSAVFFVYFLCFSRFLPLISVQLFICLCCALTHPLSLSLCFFSCFSVVAARAQLIFVDSFFVHVVYECVCLCTRMFLCMSASIFLCIPFFCRPPSSDVDVGV